MKTKLYLPLLLLSALILSLVFAPDTTYTHGTTLSNHDLVMGGSIAHWNDGEMDYKFEGTFPSNWESLINQAASHTESDTYMTSLDYGAKSKNTISIGDWPSIFGAANRLPTFTTCGYSGSSDGTEACAWPITTLGEVDFAVALGTVDNLRHVRIVIDEADVYSGSGSTVQSKWTTGRIKQVAAHEIGHSIGFFDHLNDSAKRNFMHSEAPVYNLSDEDEWNLNRLYMHTSEAEQNCFTEVDLSQSDFNNAKGVIYPPSGLGRLDNSPSCPSTAYDDGAAHYFKLDIPRSGHRTRFHAWPTSTSTNVEMFVHRSRTFDPYDNGGEYDYRSFRRDTLVQMASNDKDRRKYYQFRVTPDCTTLATFRMPRNRRLRTIHTGTLSTSDCKSSITSRGYADFYSFTLDRTMTVTIEMNSSVVDSYIYLRRGDDEQSVNQMYYNDDYPGHGLNSRISELLPKGEYTIEATSYNQRAKGRYDLRIGSSS